MPYIPQRYRTSNTYPVTPGELNYSITKLLIEYTQREGRSYTTFSSLFGVLHDVSAEFYRRVVVPYEDEKCAANGDVYPEDWTD